MDDGAELRNMILAGVALTVLIGVGMWQIASLLRSGLDGMGLIRLAFSLLVLGIMLYVAYTAFSLWAV